MFFPSFSLSFQLILRRRRTLKFFDAFTRLNYTFVTIIFISQISYKSNTAVCCDIRRGFALYLPFNVLTAQSAQEDFNLWCCIPPRCIAKTFSSQAAHFKKTFLYRNRLIFIKHYDKAKRPLTAFYPSPSLKTSKKSLLPFGARLCCFYFCRLGYRQIRCLRRAAT